MACTAIAPRALTCMPLSQHGSPYLYSIHHPHCGGAPAAADVTETCQGVAGGSGRGREAPAGTRTRARARARDESCIRAAHLWLAVASPRHFPVAYPHQDLAFSQVEPAAGQSCHDLNFSENLPRRLCSSSTAAALQGCRRGCCYLLWHCYLLWRVTQ